MLADKRHKIMKKIVLFAFLVKQLIVPPFAQTKTTQNLNRSLHQNSVNLTNQIEELNQLHEDMLDLSGYYISTGNFWLLDLTLNDLNASVKLVLDNKGIYRFDRRLDGFDKLTATIVYGSLIIQDILGFTRSQKIKSILEKYQEVFIKVNKDIVRMRRNKCFPDDLLERFEILASTLNKYMEDIYVQKSEIEAEIRFLAAYSAGYTAKVASLISERILPNFHAGRAIPGISLFIGLVWLSEETYIRHRLENHFQRIYAEKEKIELYLKKHSEDIDPVLTSVIEMKLKYLEKEQKNSSFRKLMSNCSLTYVMGDLALSLKGLAHILGLKLTAAVATGATVAGVSGAVLGSSVIVASSGRFLFNQRHTMQGQLQQFFLNRKIAGMEKRLGENEKKQHKIQAKIDEIYTPQKGKEFSFIQEKIYKLNLKMEKLSPKSRKFIRLKQEKISLLKFAMEEGQKYETQLEELAFARALLQKTKKEFEGEHRALDEKIKMQYWADKFYDLNIDEFSRFSDKISDLENDSSAIETLRSFFEEIGYDMSVFCFKPYLGVMRYISSY